MLCVSFKTLYKYIFILNSYNIKIFLLIKKDEARLDWAFKLYDVDNDGIIDIENIAAIMRTLDAMEGLSKGLLSFIFHYV